MKSYPRIYSLSTLGLIHHQEFDYLFHPIRTDFNGDSGTGKSMIADLLQLIFVGSEAFKSATVSNEPRTIDGMVLRTPNKGTDIGYAFINVEMEEGKYICVGAYLESISPHTSSFIIQSGYDFQENSKLKNLDVCLTKSSFLENDHILPLDQLKEKLEKEGIICESWQRLKPFHSILSTNKILPIDLTVNDKVLKDYAGIIRSFSRGKSLETQKSDSLKEFLFGNDKGKEIYNKYKQALNDLKSVHQDYDRNIDEINKIILKQKELVSLKEEKDIRDKDWDKLKTGELVYWSKQEIIAYSKLEGLFQAYHSGKLFISELKSIVQSEIEKHRSRTGKLTLREQEAEEAYLQVKNDHNKLQTILSWIDKLKCNESDLKVRFNDQKEKIKQKESLNRLLSLLEKNRLSELLANSSWSEGLQAGNEYYNNTFPGLLKDIEEKTALLEFSDLNNKTSLGYWAFNLKRALTLEEESAVIYFQNLSRSKPLERKGNKYLPNVEELFIPLPIIETSQDGFWLNLKGIREYVPFVKKQILNSSDSQSIRKHFEQFSNTLSEDLKKLSAQKDQLEKLKSFIDGTDDIGNLLTSYKSKEEILKFTEIPELNISIEEFESYYSALSNRKSIEAKYSKTFEDYNSAKKDKSENGVIISGLEAESTTINQYTFDDTAINNILDILPELNESIKQKASKNLKDEIDEEDIVSSVKSAFNIERSKIPNTAVLNESFSNCITSKAKKLKATETYLTLHKEPIDLNSYADQFLVLPSDIEWIASEKAYEAHFKLIVSHYLANDSFKFDQNNDFIELSRNLLPDAFQKEDITEEAVIESIRHYLSSINEKNRQLNNRKLQKIKNLIEEVSDTVSTFLNTIRNIDNFFKDKDKQISGGYQVRLERNWSTEYKKEWMDKFISDVESDELNNKLINYSSLEDKMKAAFYACGGSTSVSPTINKLLDPNSYYDLSFSMKAPDGRTNKGSTGQTYAAIALLCVARLSLIGTELDKQPQGIRFMPIDEAEGLGSNYDMLYEIAKNNDYQIISLSIGPVGKFKEGEQYVYMLHKNMEESDPVNYTPMAVFSKKDIIKSADKIIEDEQ